jgi:ATP-dependent Clp protease protease subunit
LITKNAYKIGLLISTILLVGAAGASISKFFSRTETTTAIIEKVTPIELTGKLSKAQVAISRITVTPDNAVLLDSEVNGESVGMVIEVLNEITKNNKEVFLLINSPGGSVIDGAKLIAYMDSSPVKINTVCIGLCASMAAHIHQAGAKRLVEDKSVLMFHPASGGARGTMNEMLTLLNMLDQYTARMDATAAARSGIPYDEFRVKVLKNFWLEGQDAVTQKLADGMVFMVLKGSDAPIISVTNKLGGKNATKKVDSKYNYLYDVK